MKSILFLILSILALNCYCQCPDIDFPENDNIFFDQIKNKYKEVASPNILFKNELNESFDLQSLEGKVVVLNYWNFGCKPCIEEIPELNKLVEKYKDSVYFISLISPGNIKIDNESLQTKLSNFNFQYQHLASSECFASYFGIPEIYPTHIVIGKDSKLVEVFGGVDTEKLEKAIKSSI